MKKIISISVIWVCCYATPSLADSQQQVLEEVVKEMEYLMEVVKKAQNQYQRQDHSKLKFNYEGYLSAMKQITQSTRDYLSGNVGEIRSTPIRINVPSMTKVSP